MGQWTVVPSSGDSPAVSRQARQDILAQDLAEAVGTQVELAEQLRCSREDNEKLLAQKHAVHLDPPEPFDPILA